MTDLEGISKEITEYEAPDFGALVREVHTAVRALGAAVTAHNGRLSAWTRAIRGRGATENVWTGRGGAVVADGYVQAPVTISALVKAVLTVNAPRHGVPTLSITDRSPEHVERVVTSDYDKTLDRVLRAGPVQPMAKGHTTEDRYGPSHVMSDEQHDELAAWQRRMAPENAKAREAAAMRHRRDVDGLPKDANNPSASYPVWIDDPELVAVVPDMASLVKPSTSGTVLTEAGRGRGHSSPPAGVVRTGGAAVGDDPVAV